MASLLIRGSHRMATCWKIVRTDATIFRFTDHDRPITLGSETFSPTQSVAASARSFPEGTGTSDVQVSGIIESGSITHEDLVAGKFKDAIVYEFLLDWKYPDLGYFDSRTYYITDPTFSENAWQANITSIIGRLSRALGANHSRTCPYVLGDAFCQRDLTDLTQTGRTVAAVSSPYRVFTSNATGADKYFNQGRVTFTSGANTGVVRSISKHLSASGHLELWLETPYPIQVGDQFTVVAGCDHSANTCSEKFGNIINFGGEPFIPGSDRALKTTSTMV